MMCRSVFFSFICWNEQIVLRIDAGAVLGILEVEAEPLLDAEAAQRRRAGREIHEEAEIERQRSGEDGVAAEEIDLDLHRIAEPAEDVDVVPTLFVITTRRVIVNRTL
jgi:hypothetical protein